MKIITKQEFYKLPAGTLYCDYQPYVFGELKIKGETVVINGEPIDYRYCNLRGDILEADNTDSFIDILNHAEKTGGEFDLELGEYNAWRDGLYNEEQLYAVYSKEEIKGLIKILERCT
jgi:hypothetical protein